MRQSKDLLSQVLNTVVTCTCTCICTCTCVCTYDTKQKLGISYMYVCTFTCRCTCKCVYTCACMFFQVVLRKFSITLLRINHSQPFTALLYNSHSITCIYMYINMYIQCIRTCTCTYNSHSITCTYMYMCTTTCIFIHVYSKFEVIVNQSFDKIWSMCQIHVGLSVCAIGKTSCTN